MSKMVKIVVFGIDYYYADKILIEGIKMQRRKEKTHLNIHKHFYKTELLLSMKSRAKLQWAFYRISKFSEDC
jgi:hypothetical protein